jgi:hypothetical protein
MPKEGTAAAAEAKAAASAAAASAPGLKLTPAIGVPK